MKTIAYSNPFVPPEWIAAHSLRPRRLRPPAAGGDASVEAIRGLCPFVRAFLAAVRRDADIAAVVMTTTCDQMRHAATLATRDAVRPVFLLNVPATWQTPTARALYLDELERLGRFLVELGGSRPSPARLADAMLQHEQSRRCEADDSANNVDNNGDGIPLALIGGPLLEDDEPIFDLIHQAGGYVALDGTEGGPRTLPASFDREQLESEPLAELARAYFDAIVDPFRRPNDGFYRWLARELPRRQVRGVVLWRYVWCDLWHAEAHRMKQTCSVPLLDLDTCRDDDGSLQRAAGRIEAFLEMLQ